MSKGRRWLIGGRSRGRRTRGRDPADERERVWEPFAERDRPPAWDLGVDAVVAGRCGRRGLSARDGDRAHDLVVLDQERDVAVEQDLGAVAGAAVGER